MPIPESLIPEIASRRCIILMGSGTSAGCSDQHGNHPPTWENLLEELVSRFVTLDSDKEFIRELIRLKQYLDAAEVIFTYVPSAEKTHFFREKFRTPEYNPTKLHEIIQNLDQKIVITTNYDQIYEKQCLPHGTEPGYIVKNYYDSNILDEIRSPTRLIIKAHGCVTNPQKIILTRSDYFEARLLNPSFYSLLDSLFLTHTIIFLGYSLKDPDIQLLLENANIAVPSSHPHYAIIQQPPHPALTKAIHKSYNLTFLEYSEDVEQSQGLLQIMEELNSQVESYRLTYKI